MKFIIEAHRKQDSIGHIRYAVLIDTFIAKKEVTSFDVYTSVNDLMNETKIGTVKDVTFEGVDIDTKYDTYYIALDVPDEYKSLMHEGRGAFIAKITNGEVERLDYVQKGGQ